MAKDKPRKKVSMRSLVNESAVEERQDRDENLVNTEFFNEDLNEKLIAYNEKITEISDKYASLKFRHDILVRVFVRPMQKSENGLMIPNKAPIKAPTNSGYGSIGHMDNPYPYESKAVIISLPERFKDSDLKVGQIVGLTNNPIKAVPMGRGDNVMVQIANAFVHPDDRGKYTDGITGVPEDPEDPNYGYLTLTDFDIQVIMQ